MNVLTRLALLCIIILKRIIGEIWDAGTFNLFEDGIFPNVTP